MKFFMLFALVAVVLASVEEASPHEGVLAGTADAVVDNMEMEKVVTPEFDACDSIDNNCNGVAEGWDPCSEKETPEQVAECIAERERAESEAKLSYHERQRREWWDRIGRVLVPFFIVIFTLYIWGITVTHSSIDAGLKEEKRRCKEKQAEEFKEKEEKRRRKEKQAEEFEALKKQVDDLKGQPSDDKDCPAANTRSAMRQREDQNERRSFYRSRRTGF